MFMIYEEYTEHIHGNQKYEILLFQSELDIHIVVPTAPKGELWFFLSEICPSRVHGVSGGILLRMLRLIKVIYRHKPGIIMVNNERSLLFVLLAVIMLRIPLIWYIKNFRGSLLIDLICALCAKRIFVIAPQCMEKKGIVGKIFMKKIHYLPLGVKLEPYLKLPMPSKKKIRLNILMLSAIVPAKGIDIAVEAIRIVVKKGLDLHLYIAGSAPEKHREYASLVQEKAKDLPITFLGWREDVLTLIEQADMVILPSYSEGVPRSLVESMAAGRAVIATRVGGIPHIVDHGKTGLLVDVGDGKSLATAIEQLVKNPDMREKMGLKARQYAEDNHDFERHIKMLKKHFYEVMASE